MSDNVILKGVKIMGSPLTLPVKEKSEVAGENAKASRSRMPDIESVRKKAESIVRSAREEAERILREAKAEAEKMMKEAQESADKVKSDVDKYIQEARERGYRDGFARAEEESRKKLQEEITVSKKRVEEVVNALLSVKDTILYENESLIIELFVQMLKKIVRKEVELDKEFIVRVVKAVLDRAAESTKIKLRLNPKDLDVISDYGLVDRRVELIADEHIEVGGCVAETDFGDIDACISTQLSEIESAMLSTLREGR